MAKKPEGGYNSIKVLGSIEAIRTRPGMFIGETDRPTHLLYELLDNAFDEANAGHATTIDVLVDTKSGKMTVCDNGRGFPQGFNEKEGMHDPVVAAMKLHSGGKFDKEAYKVSIGLHGVGLVACNALSDWMTISTGRGKSTFEVKFSDAIPGKPEIRKESGKSFTKVSLQPSKRFFRSVKSDLKAVEARLALAVTFLGRKIDVTLNGKRVKRLSLQDLCPGCDTDILTATYAGKNGESATLHFGYDTKAVKRDVNHGSVNLLEVNSGVHIRVMEKAVREAWKKVVATDLAEYLEEEDYLCGLRGFILVNLLKPSYTSQTKENLAGNLKDLSEMADALTGELVKVLKKKPKLVASMSAKFRAYRESLNRLSDTKFLDEAISLGEDEGSIDRSLKQGSKLLDCTSKDREGTELYIVEGDSAGGSLIPLRDPKIHAILRLRGKTLNVVDRELSRIIGNEEIRSLLNSLGTGCLHKEDETKVRYERIIIATDADVDGKNILALLLGALCYLTPKLVKSGRIYIAKAPLFGQYDRKGKFLPCWRQEDLDPAFGVERYKGLGSMNAKEVAESVMNPAKRRIVRVTLKKPDIVTDMVGSPEVRKAMLVSKGLIL